MLKLTVLMDDRKTEQADIVAEHGLSVYLEYNGSPILFDCGISSRTLDNARALGVELNCVEAVVLSHSHNDHAQGFRTLAQEYPNIRRLYTGPDFFIPKYSGKNGTCLDHTCGFDREFLEKLGIHHHTVDTAEQIRPGLWLVSGFARKYPFEEIPAKFLRLGSDGFYPDNFSDEICLAAELDSGLAVLVGCSHPGILNMVSHVSRILGKPVKAVFGGTHLFQSDHSRVEKTLEGLAALGVELLAMNHCTGETAIAAAEKSGLRCWDFRAGTRWEL